jgi:hypothetical protein
MQTSLFVKISRFFKKLKFSFFALLETLVDAKQAQIHRQQNKVQIPFL